MEGWEHPAAEHGGFRQSARPPRERVILCLLPANAERGLMILLPGRVPSKKDKQAAMTNDPIELDKHRGMNAQKDTEVRRQLQEVQFDQAVLQERQAELEKFLFVSPAVTWVEAAVKARYLIQLFAGTAEAQDARRQKLIAIVLDDLTRLSE